MKIEVDVQLLDEALHYLSFSRLQSSDLTVVKEKLSEAITEAEQRAAAERDEAITEALEDIGEIAGLLRVRADDREYLVSAVVRVEGRGSRDVTHALEHVLAALNELGKEGVT